MAARTATQHGLYWRYSLEQWRARYAAWRLFGCPPFFEQYQILISQFEFVVNDRVPLPVTRIAPEGSVIRLACRIRQRGCYAP
jgi:hypothetical protein